MLYYAKIHIFSSSFECTKHLESYILGLNNCLNFNLPFFRLGPQCEFQFLISHHPKLKINLHPPHLINSKSTISRCHLMHLNHAYFVSVYHYYIIMTRYHKISMLKLWLTFPEISFRRGLRR